MKSFNIIALTIFAMCVLGCKSPNSEVTNSVVESDTTKVEASTTDTLVSNQSSDKSNVSDYSIAYVNVQQLQESLQKFDFYKKWNERLLQKESKSTKELKSAQQKLQAELEVFQQKYQSGGFLTKESFEQEQTRLYKKDQELQALQMRLEQEFANEQIKLTKQLMDTIDTFFKIYNADHRYKMILNRADLLYADESMDITSDVLEQLNQRYATPKK
ncbi:MAG: OmpH family outer membrane protein [Paludibacteraceae bacterium]|nr:OmpH family outer membrane protein [Paludibacteraceae bacterium]